MAITENQHKSAMPLSRFKGSGGLRVLKYIVVNKPYGMLSQFTDEEGRKNLSDLGPLPRDIYPVGRLDADSEGLLLLTNDSKLIHRMLDPKFGHPRTYLVQVENIPNDRALETLRKGITIEGRKTLPAIVQLLDAEPDLPPRPIPIRIRKNIPTAWIEITLREGRNRQVRKMTAAAGHPTLRLVRTQLGDLRLGRLRPGEYKDLDANAVRRLQRLLRSEVVER